MTKEKGKREERPFSWMMNRCQEEEERPQEEEGISEKPYFYLSYHPIQGGKERKVSSKIRLISFLFLKFFNASSIPDSKLFWDSSDR